MLRKLLCALMALAILGFMLIVASLGESPRYTFDYSWADSNPPLIAHAFGGIDGYIYTNSLEAFELNYGQGHRIFEVDFDLTEDALLVCSHDEERFREYTGLAEDTPLTGSTFAQARIHGRYTPLDIRDVLALMEKYPDMYLVTDTKYMDKVTVQLQFSQLVRYAQQCSPGVLDRIIPQIYCPEMLDWVMDIHPFRSVIFTLYQMSFDSREVVDFCQRTGVRFITLPYTRDLASDEVFRTWKAQNILIAVHTLNERPDLEKYFAMGADFIYTDFAVPQDFD